MENTPRSGQPKRIAILASGNGTNAEAIINHLRSLGKDAPAVVDIVITNNEHAPVRQRASRLGVESLWVPRGQWDDGAVINHLLDLRAIDMVVLAGFMVKVPDQTVEAFRGRMVNIHPALLPLHGGKGMFGHHVHEAVIADGDKQTGITIHYVNEHYDSGDTIFQASFPVLPSDTAATIEARVHELEHRHFPVVVEQLARQLR